MKKKNFISCLPRALTINRSHPSNMGIDPCGFKITMATMFYPLCYIYIINTVFKVDTVRALVTRIGNNPLSGFRGEDFKRKVHKGQHCRCHRRQKPCDDKNSHELLGEGS